jgi:hypothetical protein
MRFRVLTAAALFAACTQFAAAAEPWSTRDARERAVMLYFTKSFGATRNGQLPLRFGLSWQQGGSIAGAPPAELLGLRFDSLGRKALSSGGAMILRLDSMKDENDNGKVDSSWDSWNDWTFYVVGTLALAGALCLAEQVICEENRRRATPTAPPDLGLRDQP